MSLQDRGAGLTNFTVDASEAGLKLMGLLERRLELPQPLLHRWIRTGQVRVNGRRTQPFARVVEGDAVRVPPFAGALSNQAKVSQERQQERAARARAPSVRIGQRPLVVSPLTPARPAPAAAVDIIAEDADFIAVFKPAGLPVHPGTGHADALSSRLEGMTHGAFRPTPVHRIDRDTTGLLLVARTYAALRLAHDAIRARTMHKEYLVWVRGSWSSDDPVTLRHWLFRSTVGGRERMQAGTRPDQGQEAVLTARCLARRADSSLLHVRIRTGRTHQIRVQLAAAGHPVLGDGKYGVPVHGHTLYLHSARIVLPDGRVFEALPRWQAPYAVDALPPAMDAVPEQVRTV